ncbi:hypothetical protein GW17_00001440 [Ensete ventricosum]|nr:hypothetical protein GW17_00001440 [Ensete ventricosum]
MGRAALVRAMPSEDALNRRSLPGHHQGCWIERDEEGRPGGARVVSHEDSSFCVYPEESLTMIPRQKKERRSSTLGKTRTARYIPVQQLTAVAARAALASSLPAGFACGFFSPRAGRPSPHAGENSRRLGVLNPDSYLVLQ